MVLHYQTNYLRMTAKSLRHS